VGWWLLGWVRAWGDIAASQIGDVVGFVGVGKLFTNVSTNDGVGLKNESIVRTAGCWGCYVCGVFLLCSGRVAARGFSKENLSDGFGIKTSESGPLRQRGGLSSFLVRTL